MDYRQLVRILAAGRIVIGGALTIVPGFAGAMWIGDIARDPRVKVMIRAMGIRDLALGAGLYRALSTGAPTRDWAVLGGVSDLVDAGATVLGARRIGVLKALPTLAVAGGSAAIHLSATDQLD